MRELCVLSACMRVNAYIYNEEWRYKGSHSIAMCAFCAFVMAPPKTLLALASALGFPFSLVLSSIFVEAPPSPRVADKSDKDDDLEDNMSSRSFNWPNFSFLCASMRFLPYASFAFLFAFSAVDGSYVFRVALATMSIWLFEFVAAKTNAWFTGNAVVDDDTPRIGCCTCSFRRCCCGYSSAAPFVVVLRGGEANLWCLPLFCALAPCAAAKEELILFAERCCC